MARKKRRAYATDLTDTQLALIAPLIFMSLHKNSFGACPAEGMDFDPDRVIEVHIELMLNGLLATPGQKKTITTKAS